MWSPVSTEFARPRQASRDWVTRRVKCNLPPPLVSRHQHRAVAPLRRLLVDGAVQEVSPIPRSPAGLIRRVRRPHRELSGA